MAQLALELNPEGAMGGARLVKRSLDDVKQAAIGTDDAVTRVGVAANDAFGKMSASASRAAKTVSELAATEMRLNNKSAYEERARDVAAYGQELDRLRAKYNPVYSALSKYKQAQAEIKQAHDVGAISANEMGAAISRERQATLASIGAIKGRTAAVKELAVAQQQAVRAMNDNTPSGGAGGFQTANIAAQFQDIAVTAQMGSSAMTIALQQGTQLASVLMTMEKPLQGIVSGFMALISPVSLITIGLIAAGVAAYQYFMSAGDNAEKTQKALETHDAAIRNLKGAYDIASAGSEKYLADTQALAQAQLIIASFEVGDRFKQEVESLIASSNLFASQAELVNEKIEAIDKTIANSGGTANPKNAALIKQQQDLYAALEGAGNAASTASSKFAPFASEIEVFLETVRRGNPDVLGLADAVANKINADPANKSLALLGKEVLGTANNAIELQRRLRGGAEAVTELDQVVVKGTGSIRTYSDAMQTLAGFIPQLDKQMKRSADFAEASTAFQKGMSELSTRFADGGMTEGLFERQAQALKDRYEAARKEISGTADAVKELRTAEREGQLGAMSDRNAELGRIRDRYAEITKNLKDAQAPASEIANAQKALEVALANANKKFDEQEAKAGESGAAKALRENEQAARALIQEYEKFSGAADRFVDRMFPEQGALRELKELQDQYMKFGGSLDQYQDAAIRQRMDELQRAADMGLRDLPENTRKRGREAADALNDTIGDTLKEIFRNGMSDVDALIDTIISGLARIGEANLENVFDKLFGKGGKGSAVSSGGGINLGSIAGNFMGMMRGGGASKQERATLDLSKNLESTSKSALDVARQFDGLNQRADSKVLDSFLSANAQWSGLSVKDTAWCAAFANASLNKAGLQGTGSNLASSFMGWGTGTNAPKPGDIVVLKPQASGTSGHVGFFAGFKDGSVQVFGGNQSKGANMKMFNLDQVSGYRTAIGTLSESMEQMPKSVQSGATTGTEAGANTGVKTGLKGIGSDFAMGKINASDSWAGLREVTGAPVAQGGQQGGAFGGMFGGGFGQNLQIGLGGFGMGAQSGDPLSGGLGGIMSGMAGGPVGMLIGGIGGLLGGLFGRSRRKKQEREAAKKALKEQMGAIEDMLDYATGTVTGGITRSMREYKDEVGKAIELAGKAGDKELKAKLEASVDQLQQRLIKDFRDAYAGNIGAMNLGFGLDNPFQAGFKSIKDMREGLLAFVDDTKTAIEAMADMGVTTIKTASGISATSSELKKMMTTFSQSANASPNTSYARGIGLQKGQFTYHDAWDIVARAAKGEIVKEAKDLDLSNMSSIWTPGDKSTNDGQELFEKLKDAVTKAKEYAAAQEALNETTSESIRLSDAQRAAITSALAELSGPMRPLSEIEEAMLELEGKAAALPPVLEELGLSADAAAAAIKDSLTTALDTLRTDYIEEINASIADLSGYGFINEVADAQKLYQDRLRDGAKLGIDGSRAFQELSLSLQSIVSDAALTEAQLNMLKDAFPELSAAFASVMPNINGELQDAQSRVDRAQQRLREAYQKEASALEETISRHKDFIKSVQQFKRDLLISDEFSPLSPYDRLQEAKAQFEATSLKALQGDPEAMEKLQSVSEAYLREAKGYYASSEAYYAAFDQVQKILGDALVNSGTQLSQAEQQLATLKETVGKLIDIDDSVLSVADAIKELDAAQAARDAVMQSTLMKFAIDMAYQQALGRPAEQAGLDYWQGQVNSGNMTVGGAVSGITNSNEAKIRQFYQEVFGRNPDSAGLAYWMSQIKNGKTLSQVQADMVYAKSQGSYALGGYTGDMGTSDVAGVVHGREFVVSAGPTAKYRSYLERMNAGMPLPVESGNNGPDRTSEILEELFAIRQVTADGAKQTIDVMSQNTQMLRTLAQEVKNAPRR